MTEANDSNPRRTKYFSDLAVKNTDTGIRESLLYGGLLKNWFHPDEKIWRNVSEHELVQTAAVLTVANLLDHPDRRINIKNLGHAAMSHDSDKRYQMQGLKAIDDKTGRGEITPDAAGKLKYDFFEESEVHSGEHLRASGVSRRCYQNSISRRASCPSTIYRSKCCTCLN